MGLSILIIVFAIAVLVLAFVGVFGRFPDNWEWVGIVLAGWGIAMGTPSVLQMVVGRPKLLTKYDRHVKDSERALVIFLMNPPIDNRSIWKILGVKRDTIESLIVSFIITEVGTRKVMIPLVNAKIFPSDEPAGVWKKRVALPPTFCPDTCVVIGKWDNTKKIFIVYGDSDTELVAGIYLIEVLLVVDGSLRTEFRRFEVGDVADKLDWIS